MSKRISLKKLTQKVEEVKGVSSASKSTLAVKGVVIVEKRLREEASNVSLNEATFSYRLCRVRRDGYCLTQNRTIKLEGLLVEIVKKEKKASKELKVKSNALAKLEEEVAELKKNKALAKKKAVEEYKTSEDFNKAIENASSKYFGEGFDFCKRQFTCHHPNLGINLDGMGPSITTCSRRKRRPRERRKEENNKGEENPLST
ncbi:hypothetical protein Acr_00g0066810 [Actinidia rufa]|uniref:Uncharacterized protein n=1 Tax=Actinidia rufa TaxID=165716 RepID=A0A7J0DQ93_9ERIC|nr:hypothetical protein Acr_00g0066810 [Actinidia rufa]